MPQPLIIEVAVNGAVSKVRNPNVPQSVDELHACIGACVEAGASVVHVHAGAPVVGGRAAHDAGAYAELFRRVERSHPGVLLYPTLPGGGIGMDMQQRYAHVDFLRAAGLLRVAPIDPGTMNYGVKDDSGRPPVHDAVYQNTYADVDFAFAYCRAHRIGCTMSVFEPGFLQLVLAHKAAGSLPGASIVKLEFASGRRLFGLPPTPASLQAYLGMLGATALPWMLAVRDGDAAATLGREAIGLGGHVRVGIEDYGGARTPRNEELVAEIASMARRAGRPPANARDAARILGLPDAGEAVELRTATGGKP